MITAVLTILVAAIHFYIMFLEMLMWTKPMGRNAFNTTEGFSKQTRSMAANQGIYNGFLALGLVVALWRADTTMQIYMLACVAVAGLFGAATFSRKTLVLQALPAAIALTALLMGL